MNLNKWNWYRGFNDPNLKVINDKGQSACWEFLRREPGIYEVVNSVPIRRIPHGTKL